MTTRLTRSNEKVLGGVCAGIADYFDLIAGTSTGGILSCAYTCPGKDGRPKFTAKEAVDIAKKEGISYTSTTELIEKIIEEM